MRNSYSHRLEQDSRHDVKDFDPPTEEREVLAEDTRSTYARQGGVTRAMRAHARSLTIASKTSPPAWMSNPALLPKTPPGR